MRLLYSFLFYLISPLIFLRLLWKSRKRVAYRKRWAERLGFFTIPSDFQNGIWIHAASVGEVVAATPMVKELRKRYPQMPITFTTITPTGSERVTSTLGNQVFHVYLPYDFPCAVNRFLKKVKPRLLIIMETELWMNVLYYTHSHSIPIILANARLSQKSWPRYRRFKFFTQSMLQYVDRILAQDKISAERFIAVGATQNQVEIVGNLKFDASLPQNIIEKGQQLRAQLGTQRPIWIAASTHPGEEAIVLNSLQQIKSQHPELLLILAPRHPERKAEILELCKQHAFTVVTRSSKAEVTNKTDVFLADTLGELMLFYAASDIAFVGGSLVPIGGHNILEPAQLGLPIINGSQLFNITQIAQYFIDQQAMRVVNNENELVDTMVNLLKNPEECKRLGSSAKQIVDQNRGALERHVVEIGKFIP